MKSNPIKLKLRRSTLTGVVAAGMVSSLYLTSPTVEAQEWTERIRLSGFFSAAYQVTDEKAFFNGGANEAGIDDKGSFQGTSLGLNINADISEEVFLATQLVGTSEDSGYVAHVDWAFLGWQLNDQLTLRAGKIKYPVGLVNDYVDVGFAYPWITAPAVIYSELLTGPQATREAYTGASLLWSQGFDDWELSADLFAGEVNLEAAKVRELAGLTLGANWNDNVQLQASTYQGTMENAEGAMAVMNGKEHSATVLGIKADWNNVVVYSEVSDVEMEDLKAMDSDSWYVTTGYRFGRLLPHLTYERFDQGDGDEQTIITLGLRWDVLDNTAVKFEVGQIDTEINQTGSGGLFDRVPDDDQTMKYGVAVDTVF